MFDGVKGFKFTDSSERTLVTLSPTAEIGGGISQGVWTLSKYEKSGPSYSLQTLNSVNFNGTLDGFFGFKTGRRNIVIELECSEGTRLEREDYINYYINFLSYGLITFTETTRTLPLRENKGYCTVRKVYNNNVHAKIEINILANLTFN